MKEIPKEARTRRCKNCEHCEIYEEGKYCSYWRAWIGDLIAVFGCDRYEYNLHDYNAARQSPKTRDKGIHQEE